MSSDKSRLVISLKDGGRMKIFRHDFEIVVTVYENYRHGGVKIVAVAPKDIKIHRLNYRPDPTEEISHEGIGTVG